MSPSLTYTPIGADSIVFACSNAVFWKSILERFGFQSIAQPGAGPGSAAMAYGDVRLLLADLANGERGPEIERFLAEHGDMQVFSAAIRVDDAVRARQELSPLIGCSPIVEETDAFGAARRFRLLLPYSSTVSWELVERADNAPATPPRTGPVGAGGTEPGASAVDHFAIAVRDLSRWESLYLSLGFEVIYVPGEEIAGEHSGMKTVALQRGGWVVALVEGVDRGLPSQVSTYARAHGDHAIQHMAIRFNDLPGTLEGLLSRGVRFRLRRLRDDETGPPAVEDIMHEGMDHHGPLLQCFTKPLARRAVSDDPQGGEGGFFFELIQRLAARSGAATGAQAFHDPTVIGLYRSIEHEELRKDHGLIFEDMGDYPVRS